MRYSIPYCILINGNHRSGKDQFAEFLKEEFIILHELKDFNELERVQTARISDALKHLCWHYVKDVQKHYKGHIFLKKENFFNEKTELSRFLIELVGKVAIEEFDQNYFLEKTLEQFEYRPLDCLIVSDYYFDIDKEFFQSKKFKIITVNISRNGSKKSRTSKELKDENFDWKITNNGSLDQLRQKAKQIINKIFK